ncbi:MAG: OmpH family outer membrane protein [Gallionellaceae bacterium]|nr:OmpH family outer membrane protein [Gallionellaceae bacterium]
MRKLLVYLFLLMSCATASAADLKIGFVNTEKLFRESPVAVRAQKKLEQEFARREQDIQKQIKQARDIQAALEKDGLTMAEAEKTRRERDLANLSREIQRAQREYREDLNQRRNEEFSAIHQKARKLIQDIAEKEKYDLILENVVHASPRIDITDRVMKSLER